FFVKSETMQHMMKLSKIIGIGLLLSIVSISCISRNSKSTQIQQEYESLISSDILREGDIVFQTGVSDQCEAIKLATKSDYTHCGIIFKEGHEFFVYEAVQPVSSTPL